MNTVAQNTDFLASFASATVKKRIRMCGRPAVPNISAMPRLMDEAARCASVWVATAPPPGLRIAACFGLISTARANRSLRLKPKVESTQNAM